jgi:hypothetical protein
MEYADYFREYKLARQIHSRAQKQIRRALIAIDKSTRPVSGIHDLEELSGELKTPRVHYNSHRRNKAAAVISIISFIGGLFFLSSNITGNTISSLNSSASNIIGVILILIGLIGAFFWFNRK